MIEITGLGLVCSLGMNSKEGYAQLLKCTPGNSSSFLASPTMVSPQLVMKKHPVVAEVKLSKQEIVEKLGLSRARLRRLGRASLLSLLAVKEAIEEAKLMTSGISPERIGIFGGSTLGGSDQLERAVREYLACGSLSQPHLMMSASYGALNDLIAEVFDLKGCRLMISTACSSSTVVMSFARQMLLKGELDAAIVYGVDPIAETSLAGFTALGALTNGVSAPFSKAPAGIAIGEGSAALVLERRTTARTASPIWLGGVGVGSEAFHLTAPDSSGRGAKEVMNEAITQAGRQPADIQFVVAHGTGTELNDGSEAKAIQSVLPHPVHVMSTKGATGHTLGGAGAINAVVGCLSLRNSVLPPSPNFTEPRLGVKVSIPNQPIPKKITGVLANSFGFAGSVASASFFSEKPEAVLPQYSEKVAITGMGSISPTGISTQALQQALLNGTRHFSSHAVNHSFTGKFASLCSGTINLEDDPTIKTILRKSRNSRRMDRTSLLSYVATTLAIQDSGIKISSLNQRNIALFLGNDAGPHEVIRQFYSQIVTSGFDSGNPSLFPNTVLNACLGYITIDHHIHGPSATVAQGEVASGVAISLADLTLFDSTSSMDAVICGGVDEYSEYQEKCFLDLLQIPSHSNADSINEPFHPQSKGFLLGEASIVFVIEKARKADQRSAKVIAEYLGSVQSGLGNGGESSYREVNHSVSRSLNDAVARFGQPDLLISNVNGYPLHDQAILSGVSKSLVALAPHYSPSRVFGNCRGTSGALGVFAGITAIQHQKLPDPDRRKLSEDGKVERVFVLSSGVGGVSVVNVLQRSGTKV